MSLASLALGVTVFMAGYVLRARVTPLVMGTHAGFAPFEMREGGEDSEIVGFDVEVGRAIAARAGRPLQIVDLPFEALIPALESGVVDLLAVAMTITPERAERVDFSDPYYRATQVVLMRAGGLMPETKEELRGRRIGVQAGTTSREAAMALTGPENVKEAATAVAAVGELQNEGVDYVLMDEQPAVHFARTDPGLQMVRLGFEDEFYGVAVRKGNTELLRTVNAALAAIGGDGRYEWFIDRWMMQDD